MPAGGTVECNICMEMVPAAAVPRRCNYEHYVCAVCQEGCGAGDLCPICHAAVLPPPTIREGGLERLQPPPPPLREGVLEDLEDVYDDDNVLPGCVRAAVLDLGMFTLIFMLAAGAALFKGVAWLAARGEPPRWASFSDVYLVNWLWQALATWLVLSGIERAWYGR